MIAGVVISLRDAASRLEATVCELRATSQLELGPFTPATRRIPATIEAADNNQMELVTRQLQELSGVTFVDVVFVHLEDTLAEV